jgi:hypothetical protein
MKYYKKSLLTFSSILPTPNQKRFFDKCFPYLQQKICQHTTMRALFSVLNKTRNYVIHQNANKKIGSFFSYTEKKSQIISIHATLKTILSFKPYLFSNENE